MGFSCREDLEEYLDYQRSLSPRYEIKDNVVVMPDGETTICQWAFWSCRFVIIIIPEGVTVIGYQAFYECYALREVHLPSTLQEIGDYAFYDCTSLVTIVIPNGVTTIGQEAFRGCAALREVQLPSTLQEIGMAAFFNCTSLVTIIIPNGVIIIGERAFSGCEALREIQLPSTLQKIGWEGFKGCYSLVTIIIPNGVTTIGGNAFKGCQQLAVVFLPDTIPTKDIVSKNVFENCPYSTEHYAETTSSKSSVSNICYYHYVDTIQGKTSSNSLLQILQDKWKNDSLAFQESTDSCGRNPVHICAALKGINVDVIKFLVDKIPNALTSKDTANKTPIHHACARGIVDFNVMKVLSSNVSAFVADKNGDTPLALGIRYGKLPLDISTFLYSVHPISTAEIKGEEENKFLNKIQEEYLKTIMEWNENMPTSSLQQQHGWIKYLTNHVQEGSDAAWEISKFLRETCDDTTLKMLAYAKDVEGRNFAMDVAPSSIKGAFQERLFFFGRYDIHKRPPLHKSPTCVVVQAIDMNMNEYYEEQFDKLASGGNCLSPYLFLQALKQLNMVSSENKNIESLDKVVDNFIKEVDINKDGQITKSEFISFCLDRFSNKVVLKFMRDRNHFDRESKEFRNVLDSRYVIKVLRTHTCGNDESSKKNTKMPDEVKSHLVDLGDNNAKPEDYKYILVMPLGDRNLDMATRSEMFTLNQSRIIMQEVGYAVSHLHDNGIIHGDLKMSNVVRVDEKFHLTDFDASVQKNEEYVGEKFSSGVVPPEMIVRITEAKDSEKYNAYFGLTGDEDNDAAKKIQLRVTKDLEAGFMVKTFKTILQKGESKEKFGKTIEGKDSLVPIKEGLPYKDDLVKASESFDVWSFGVMSYNLCKDNSSPNLFSSVNQFDDFTNVEDFIALYEWSDDDSHKFDAVRNRLARDLIKKILKRNPKDRPSMKKILEDDFFNTDDLTNDTKELKGMIRDGFKDMKKDNKKIQEQLSSMHSTLASVELQTRGLQNYQLATTRMLKTVLKGGSAPRYFYIVPELSEGKSQTYWEKTKNLADFSNLKSTLFFQKMKLYFVCPVTFKVAKDENNDPIGYDIEDAQKWIVDWGPSILIGLKVMQFAFATGKLFGLPLPFISDASDGVNRMLSGDKTLQFLGSFQEMVMNGVTTKLDEAKASFGGEDDDTWVDLAEKVVEDTSSISFPEGERNKEIMVKSCEEIKKLATKVLNDEKFEKCGLIEVTSKDGLTEFVHPDIVPLFVTYGKKCYEFSPQQLDRMKIEELRRVQRKANKENLERKRHMGDTKSASTQEDGDETNRSNTNAAEIGEIHHHIEASKNISEQERDVSQHHMEELDSTVLLERNETQPRVQEVEIIGLRVKNEMLRFVKEMESIIGHETYKTQDPHMEETERITGVDERDGIMQSRMKELKQEPQQRIETNEEQDIDTDETHCINTNAGETVGVQRHVVETSETLSQQEMNVSQPCTEERDSTALSEQDDKMQNFGKEEVEDIALRERNETLRPVKEMKSIREHQMPKMQQTMDKRENITKRHERDGKKHFVTELGQDPKRSMERNEEQDHDLSEMKIICGVKLLKQRKHFRFFWIPNYFALFNDGSIRYTQDKLSMDELGSDANVMDGVCGLKKKRKGGLHVIEVKIEEGPVIILRADKYTDPEAMKRFVKEWTKLHPS